MNRAIVVTLLLLAGQAPAESRGGVTAIEPSDENILDYCLTLNLNTVAVVYFCPGLNTTDGKSGLFGESGKC